jgi:hypothetical protein
VAEDDDGDKGAFISNRDLLAANQITHMIVNHPDILYEMVLKLNKLESEWKAAGNVCIDSAPTAVWLLASGGDTLLCVSAVACAGGAASGHAVPAVRRRLGCPRL